MDFEVPVLQKCCFFFPLRPGLLVFGYFKMVVALALEIFFARWQFIHGVRPYLVGFTIAVIIIDSGATIILLLGCHKKHLPCITWFYTYSLYLLTFKLIALFIVSMFHSIPWQVVPNLFLHAYLLLLIRSEIIKLNTQKEAPCEFVNVLANPKCTINVVKIEVDNEKGIDSCNTDQVPDNVVVNCTHVENDGKHTNIAGPTQPGL